MSISADMAPQIDVGPPDTRTSLLDGLGWFLQFGMASFGSIAILVRLSVSVSSLWVSSKGLPLNSFSSLVDGICCPTSLDADVAEVLMSAAQVDLV